MKTLFLSLALSACALAQSTNYPGAIDTDANMFVTADFVQSTLPSAVGIGDASVTVADGSRFLANMVVTICDAQVSSGAMAGKCTVWEHMKVTAVLGNVLTVTRGFAGTTARVHAAGRAVSLAPKSVERQVFAASVVAIETALGAGLSNIAAVPTRNPTLYDFTPQTPGGSLIVGNNAITMTPVPLGVNGTDVNHRLWVYDGSGTAEPCLISGGAGLSGQTSGQIIINCAFIHSGAWKIKSATAGIVEANWTLPANGGKISAPAGAYTIYAPIILGNGDATNISTRNNVYLEGVDAGNGSGVATDYGTQLIYAGPTNLGGMIQLKAMRGGGIRNMKLHDGNTGVLPLIDALGGYGMEFANLLAASYSACSGTEKFGFKISGLQSSYGFGSNTLRNVLIYNVGAACSAMSIDKGIDGGVSQNVFQGVTYFFSGDAGTAGLWLECADNNTFLQNHSLDAGTGLGHGLFLKGCATSPFPIENYFYSNAWQGGDVGGDGPQGQWSNMFFGHSTSDVSVLPRQFNGPVTSISNASPAVITKTNHGLLTGDYVSFTGGTGNWAAINNSYTITKLTANTFSVAIDSSAFGAYGAQTINLRHNANFIGLADPYFWMGNLKFVRQDGATKYCAFDPDNTNPGIICGDIGAYTYNADLNTNPANGAISYYAVSRDAKIIAETNTAGNPRLQALADGSHGIELQVQRSSGLSSLNIVGGNDFIRFKPDGLKMSLQQPTTAYQDLNYIASETGANNAIAGALTDAVGNAVTLAAGLRVTVKLAHTLQAGADTFNLNGGGAVNIKSSRDVANNIGVAYAATGVIRLFYDGTQWVDCSQ